MKRSALNSLEQYFAIYGHATEGMNILQERGLISDECIDAGSVAEEDCFRAMKFLSDIRKGMIHLD